MHGQHAHALAIGWQVMKFAREPRPKALADYLKPEPTIEQKRARGAADVAAMLNRRAKKSQREK